MKRTKQGYNFQSVTNFYWGKKWLNQHRFQQTKVRRQTQSQTALWHSQLWMRAAILPHQDRKNLPCTLLLPGLAEGTPVSLWLFLHSGELGGVWASAVLRSEKVHYPSPLLFLASTILCSNMSWSRLLFCSHQHRSHHKDNMYGNGLTSLQLWEFGDISPEATVTYTLWERGIHVSTHLGTHYTL